MKISFDQRALALALLAVLAVAVPASAGTVLQMDLDSLVERSGHVYRATVLAVEPGTVTAGGGELPTIVYRLRVDDELKGTFDADGKEAVVVELTVLGNLKDAGAPSGVARLAHLPQTPRLERHAQYVLFTTPTSAIGLSTTVGLGQGAFKIYDGPDHEELAVNELGNLGLFSGPVTYTTLADAVRARVGG